VKTIIAAFAISAAVAGCAYPVSTVEQGGASAALYVSSAPVGARVLVDDKDAGDATSFDGKTSVLAVTPGPHRVVVQVGSTRIFDKSVYVGAGARVKVKVG
jgi:hypothetical protein